MNESDLLRELEQEWGALAQAPETTSPPPVGSRAGLAAMPVRPLALFAQLEEVLHLWRGLNPDRMRAFSGRYLNSGWTLKDMLGHLATWAEEFLSEIETVTAGGEFDYAIPNALSVFGPIEWNEKQAEVQRPVSVDEIRTRFENATRRVQELVLDLPQESLYALARFPLAPDGDPEHLWVGNIAMIVMGKCAHDRHHLGQITRWLERLEAPAD